MALKQSKEYIIEHEILTYLAKLNIGFFWKNTSGGFFDGKRFRKHSSPFAIRGTSDILGIVNGKFIALEVKTETGRASAEQIAFIQKVKASGGQSSVVRSVCHVKELFQEWGLISQE